MKPANVARGLAWFGIGLGIAEVLAPRAVARWAGLRGHESLIRAFGLREIGTGVAILRAAKPETLAWTRVAGDGLDGGLLAYGMRPDNPHRDRTVMAALAVAPVVALDVATALQAHGEATRSQRRIADTARRTRARSDSPLP